jgi:hypothetical protein
VPALLVDRLFGRAPTVRAVGAIMLLGAAALWAGLAEIAGSPKAGFTYGGALDGLASQASTTVPAAILIAAAAALNVLVGAAVLRLLGAPPFRTLSESISAGFAAAVVIDTATLFVLGGLGLFAWPWLLAIQLAVLFAWQATPRAHPLLACRPALRPRRPAAWWPLIAAVWAGPLIVQIASPAAPFFDVLPNHVAPVEHLRTFGSFATLTTSPSPIYGPSRLLLGYVATLGQLAALTGTQAALATAAFALPLTVVTAVSLRRLAARLFGAGAGFWVLLTFPLTFAFMRLPDTRGTVMALPLAAYALTSIFDHLAKAEPGRGRQAAGSGFDVGLAFALGATFLVHPLMGVMMGATACGLLVLEPRRLAAALAPALAAAVLIAAPQAATMLGVGAPALLGFVWLGVALPAGFLAARVVEPAVSVALGRLPVAHRAGYRAAVFAVQAGLILSTIAVALLVGRDRIPTPNDPASYLVDHFQTLTETTVVGAAVGLLVARRGWIVLGTAIAAGLAAWAASTLVGRETLTEQAVHYEVPKAVQYWLPVMLALGAAGAISALWRVRRLGFVRHLGLVVFVVAVTFPYPGPIISSVQIGEHRGAESVGLALREAELGYWLGFPDSRLIVGPTQREVVDRIRVEIDAGRLGPSTKVLHLAASFQQWRSVPIGVFTGALETSISLDPELSIHTEGGRLLGFDSLPAELASDYGYVVVEPAGLADAGIEPADEIVAAGYRLIWSNSIAQIYARDG